MRHSFVRNPVVNIKELLKTGPYYNIAAMLLAVKENNFIPMIEIYGEAGAFKEIRKIIHYSRFLKNCGNPNIYPIGLGKEGKILRPHEHVPSMILANIESIPYMITNEGTPDLGLDWVQKYSSKDLLISYYDSLLES